MALAKDDKFVNDESLKDLFEKFHYDTEKVLNFLRKKKVDVDDDFVDEAITEYGESLKARNTPTATDDKRSIYDSKDFSLVKLFHALYNF